MIASPDRGIGGDIFRGVWAAEGSPHPATIPSAVSYIEDQSVVSVRWNRWMCSRAFPAPIATQAIGASAT